MDGITRAELAAMETRILEAVRYGTGEINRRLDTLNGKTFRHGEALAAHTVRLDGIDESVDGLEAAIAESSKGENRRVTIWDVGIVLAVIFLTAAFFKYAGWAR